MTKNQKVQRITVLSERIENAEKDYLKCIELDSKDKTLLTELEDCR